MSTRNGRNHLVLISAQVGALKGLPLNARAVQLAHTCGFDRCQFYGVPRGWLWTGIQTLKPPRIPSSGPAFEPREVRKPPSLISSPPVLWCAAQARVRIPGTPRYLYVYRTDVFQAGGCT